MISYFETAMRHSDERTLKAIAKTKFFFLFSLPFCFLKINVTWVFPRIWYRRASVGPEPSSHQPSDPEDTISTSVQMPWGSQHQPSVQSIAWSDPVYIQISTVKYSKRSLNIIPSSSTVRSCKRVLTQPCFEDQVFCLV